jgi:hypothetical protein
MRATCSAFSSGRISAPVIQACPQGQAEIENDAVDPRRLAAMETLETAVRKPYAIELAATKQQVR